MTQADLADRIGVTRQTIIAIEQGRYSPSLEMAFRIARVFGVPLDDVFQYPDAPEEDDMKAIVQDAYGSADVLRLRDIDQPDDRATTRCSSGCARPASTPACGTS